MIGRYALQTESWPDLPAFLASAVGSPHAFQREVAMSILSNLVETMGEHLRPLWTSLLPSLQAGLQDPVSSRVRIDAMRYDLSIVYWMDF
jgi:hypothetical protein